MDFVKRHFEKLKLTNWTLLAHFFSRSALISTDLEKRWAKSVQLVAFFQSDFLQNPYFSGNCKFPQKRSAGTFIFHGFWFKGHKNMETTFLLHKFIRIAGFIQGMVFFQEIR